MISAFQAVHPSSRSTVTVNGVPSILVLVCFCISSRRPDSEWLAAGLHTASGWTGVVEKLTVQTEKLTAGTEKLTARAEKQKKEQGISGKIPTYPL